MAKAIINKDSQKVIDIDKHDFGDLDLNDEVKAKLLHTKEEKDQDIKKQKAIKSIKKLLNVSEKYSAFCNNKLSEAFEKSEEERVNYMMKKRKNNDSSLAKIQYFKGVLKDYQVVGVNWLKTLFEHGVNGILADEMGLGKTVQVIALICYLIERTPGPFLIVVPLSTFPNWSSEFKRFAPDIPVVLFHAEKTARESLMCDVLKFYKFGQRNVRPVVISTVRMIAKELEMFKKITWLYLIIDEAHCLKNHESQISQNMRSLKCLNKLLLTGTPLQNNLKELWSILNFTMPSIFKNIDTFSSLFILQDFDDNSKIVKEEQNNNVISSLHKILQPFMLRRLKSDVLHDVVPKKEVMVYCPLTNLQRKLYMFTIKKNMDGLLGREQNKQKEDVCDGQRPKRRCTQKSNYKDYLLDFDENSSREATIKEAEQILNEKIEKDTVQFIHNITMQNSMIMLKKVVNHPYLVHMPVTPDKKHILVDERLVTESGKMLVLDVMLTKLKARKHKVLIFSTLVIILDLIEEYMIMRNLPYCRLDGSHSLLDRADSVERFNSDPNIFAFLLSSRAGGLGINLTSADTVIIYDKDWNPQVDIQAQDRCHRIGQTKPVMVYSLITKNTIDDKIVSHGNMKRKLEKVIIEGGKFKNPTLVNKNLDLDLDDLLEMLNKDDSSLIIHQNKDIFSDDEWEKLLDRSDLYEQMKTQLGINYLDIKKEKK